MKQYITLSNLNKKIKSLPTVINKFSLDGIEINLNAVTPREFLLFTNEKEKELLISKLQSLCVKRIHMSYWAEPTDFICKIDYPGLVKRYGTEKDVIKYYGDLTGEQMFKRWVQEYKIASDLNAEAVTFHLIDYFHIDGIWEFTNSKEQILDGMIMITQKLLDLLDKEKLLKKGPKIELENAGFGLEYGAQTAENFDYIFKNLEDKYYKLRIAWDTNHLLHALGIKNKKGIFYLTKDEITPVMLSLQSKYGKDPELFASKWIEHNILYKKTQEKVASIHLSDCKLKKEAIFKNGRLTKKLYQNIMKKNTDEE